VASDLKINISPSRDSFSPGKLEKITGSQKTGAKVSFRGIVRSPNRGKEVSHLVYECYPEMARDQLEEIFNEARSKFSAGKQFECGINICLGKIPAGKTSIVITVASAHRKPAFESCRYILERLKKEVPIWKKEIYTDGETWVENPGVKT